jgi:hypothetical protein
MAGLVPAIHVFLAAATKNVDARDKPGHDEFPINPRFYWLLYELDSEEPRACAASRRIKKRCAGWFETAQARLLTMRKRGCCFSKLF